MSAKTIADRPPGVKLPPIYTQQKASTGRAVQGGRDQRAPVLVLQKSSAKCVSAKGKPLSHEFVSSTVRLINSASVAERLMSDYFYMYPCAICGTTYIYQPKDQLGRPVNSYERTTLRKRLSMSDHQPVVRQCSCGTKRESFDHPAMVRLEVKNLDKLWVYKTTKDMLPYVVSI